MNMKTKLVRVLIDSFVIGCWKSDKEARHNRGRCIYSFKFFRWMKQQQTHIFWCLFGYTVPGNKFTIQKYHEITTSSEKFEAEITRKLRTVQPQLKVAGSYLKKIVYKKITSLEKNGSIFSIKCTFSQRLKNEFF